MKFFKTFYKSVAARTTFMVVLMLLIIMGIGSVWQMQHVTAVVGAEARRQASKSMESAIKVIENRISNVETAVSTAASYADMLAPHESLVGTLLERLIAENNDIAAATLLYRENYFPEYGRYYAPTISRDPMTGELTEDEIGGPEHDFSYLETDSNWVYTNILDRGYWCLPYVDSMSTKRAMVTYSVPLHDSHDRIYAVLCADVDLRWVQQIVEEAKPFDFSKVSVLSRDGQFICHSDSANILSVNTLQIEKNTEEHSKEELDLLQRMLRGEKGSDSLMSMAHFLDSSPKGQDDGTSIVFYAPVDRVLWSVSFSIPEDKILEQANQLRKNMTFMLILLLILLSLGMYYIINAQLWPLRALAKSTKDVAKGNFLSKLPNLYLKDEVGSLRDSFEEMQHSLANYVEKLKQTTASKASLLSELRVASNIQMAMLPKKASAYADREDVDVYGFLKSAKEVGGDLYDYFIRDEKLFFCIGDVSGKGVPASLLMATTKALFRMASAHDDKPSEILKNINIILEEQNDYNMFVTMFVGVLNLATGDLNYSNACHDAPMLVSAEGIKMLETDANLPVGVMGDMEYTLQHTTLQPHTTIFLYTDGLTEAEDVDYNQFGEKRMRKVAQQMLVDGNDEWQQPGELVKKIENAVASFVGKAEQSDDLTMLAISFMKKA